MLRLITSPSPDAPSHVVGNLTTTLPAIVEHDEDGIRWLVIDYTDFDIPRALWARAVSEGVAGVLVPLSNASITATTAARIDEDGRERPNGRIFTMGVRWVSFDQEHGAPTYQEVTAALALAEARAQMPTSAHADVSTGFVHLHTHSEFSPLDGLSRMDEIVREVTGHGQTSLAITDHGTCAGHPELQRAADKAGIKPIFGIEAYLCDDRLLRPSNIPEDDPFFWRQVNKEGEKIPAAQVLQNSYWHVCLLAENDTGLRNIWAASTESFRDGFYYRPRMDWDTLARHNEGVIATTGCLRGPIAVALEAGDTFMAAERLTRLMDMFPGRLYVELQPNDMDKQRNLNAALVGLAREFDLPLLATVDSHFPTAADAHTHEVWIACQLNKDVQDEGDLFAEDLDLYVMGEDQVRAGLAYLGQDVVDEAISNTVELADRCNARIEGGSSTPSFTGDPAKDAGRLHELCTANWDRLPIETHEQNQLYKDRYHREMRLLVDKGFCGYYLMVADYVGWAKDNGILVGPGRGSGGGSLVAYLARITSLDPIRHDLLFERFLTKGRAGLPDFDVDFPASKKGEILGYLRQRWGDKYVVSIGSEGRLKNKAVLDNLLRAMKSRLPENAEADLKQVKELIKEAEAGSAGLGMSWEDLWIQHGDQLQPYADRYPELFDMAEKLVGRLKSYGRHAAGVIISTDKPLTDWIPLRSVDGVEQMVSQWAMNDVEAIGLVKFDILTLGTLDVVQMCLDLIYERRQYRVDPETWDIEFEDPMVWEQLQAAHTLGVFQIETHSGTRLCERMRPRNLPELADMVTIVRPGPKNSGLTDAYLRRRAGEQAVSYPDPRLEELLAPTWGAMIYQEQVMAVTRILAGYDESEADSVRKILGKKKVEAIHGAGQEFLSRADLPREAAEHLWNQMAEFSKYGFNKSHAYAYAMLAYWTAFLKVHYPVEFLVAAMSTVDDDKLPGFVKESRRLGVAVLPPDINASGKGFSADPDQRAVRYGLDSVKGIGEAAVGDLTVGQPYTSWPDFQERKGPKANAGVVGLLARVGAFDKLMSNRRALEAQLLAKKTGESTRCIYKQDGVVHLPDIIRMAKENIFEFEVRQAFERTLLPPDTCTFDWSTEPVPVNKRTGKKLKPKSLPKKCTKACRQYVAPAPMDLEIITPYTDEDIRQIEFEMLGTYLTSTPFDRMKPKDREVCKANAERLRDGAGGHYIVAAILTSVRPHRLKPMGFIGAETEISTLSAAVFQDTWEAERPRLTPGQLCLLELRKTDRGLNLVTYQPL